MFPGWPPRQPAPAMPPPDTTFQSLRDQHLAQLQQLQRMHQRQLESVLPVGVPPGPPPRPRHPAAYSYPPPPPYGHPLPPPGYAPPVPPPEPPPPEPEQPPPPPVQEQPPPPPPLPPTASEPGAAAPDSSSLTLEEQQQYYYKQHLLSLQRKKEWAKEEAAAAIAGVTPASAPQAPGYALQAPPLPVDETPQAPPSDDATAAMTEDPEQAQRLRTLQEAAAHWQQHEQHRLGFQYQGIIQKHNAMQQLLQRYQQILHEPPHLAAMSVDIQLQHYEMQQKQFLPLYQEWENQFKKWQELLQTYPHKDQLQSFHVQWTSWQAQLKATKSQLKDKVSSMKSLKQQYGGSHYMAVVPQYPAFPPVMPPSMPFTPGLFSSVPPPVLPPVPPTVYPEVAPPVPPPTVYPEVAPPVPPPTVYPEVAPPVPPLTAPSAPPPPPPVPSSSEDATKPPLPPVTGAPPDTHPLDSVHTPVPPSTDALSVPPPAVTELAAPPYPGQQSYPPPPPASHNPPLEAPTPNLQDKYPGPKTEDSKPLDPLSGASNPPHPEPPVTQMNRPGGPRFPNQGPASPAIRFHPPGPRGPHGFHGPRSTFDGKSIQAANPNAMPAPDPGNDTFSAQNQPWVQEQPAQSGVTDTKSSDDQTKPSLDHAAYGPSNDSWERVSADAPRGPGQREKADHLLKDPRPAEAAEKKWDAQRGAGRWDRPEEPSHRTWDRPEEPSHRTWDRPEEPSHRSWDRPEEPSHRSWDRPEEPSHRSWDRPEEPSHRSWDRPEEPSHRTWDRPEEPSHRTWDRPEEPSHRTWDRPEESRWGQYSDGHKDRWDKKEPFTDTDRPGATPIDRSLESRGMADNKDDHNTDRVEDPARGSWSSHEASQFDRPDVSMDDVSSHPDERPGDRWRGPRWGDKGKAPPGNVPSGPDKVRGAGGPPLEGFGDPPQAPRDNFGEHMNAPSDHFGSSEVPFQERFGQSDIPPRGRGRFRGGPPHGRFDQSPETSFQGPPRDSFNDPEDEYQDYEEFPEEQFGGPEHPPPWNRFGGPRHPPPRERFGGPGHPPPRDWSGAPRHPPPWERFGGPEHPPPQDWFGDADHPPPRDRFGGPGHPPPHDRFGRPGPPDRFRGPEIHPSQDRFGGQEMPQDRFGGSKKPFPHEHFGGPEKPPPQGRLDEHLDYTEEPQDDPPSQDTWGDKRAPFSDRWDSGKTRGAGRAGWAPSAGVNRQPFSMESSQKKPDSHVDDRWNRPALEPKTGQKVLLGMVPPKPASNPPVSYQSQFRKANQAAKGAQVGKIQPFGTRETPNTSMPNVADPSTEAMAGQGDRAAVAGSSSAHLTKTDSAAAKPDASPRAPDVPASSGDQPAADRTPEVPPGTAVRLDVPGTPANLEPEDSNSSASQTPPPAKPDAPHAPVTKPPARSSAPMKRDQTSEALSSQDKVSVTSSMDKSGTSQTHTSGVSPGPASAKPGAAAPLPPTAEPEAAPGAPAPDRPGAPAPVIPDRPGASAPDRPEAVPGPPAPDRPEAAPLVPAPVIPGAPLIPGAPAPVRPRAPLIPGVPAPVRHRAPLIPGVPAPVRHRAPLIPGVPAPVKPGAPLIPGAPVPVRPGVSDKSEAILGTPSPVNPGVPAPVRPEAGPRAPVRPGAPWTSTPVRPEAVTRSSTPMRPGAPQIPAPARQFSPRAPAPVRQFAPRAPAPVRQFGPRASPPVRQGAPRATPPVRPVGPRAPPPARPGGPWPPTPARPGAPWPAVRSGPPRGSAPMRPVAPGAPMPVRHRGAHMTSFNEEPENPDSEYPDFLDAHEIEDDIPAPSMMEDEPARAAYPRGDSQHPEQEPVMEGKPFVRMPFPEAHRAHFRPDSSNRDHEDPGRDPGRFEREYGGPYHDEWPGERPRHEDIEAHYQGRGRSRGYMDDRGPPRPGGRDAIDGEREFVVRDPFLEGRPPFREGPDDLPPFPRPAFLDEPRFPDRERLPLDPALDLGRRRLEVDMDDWDRERYWRDPYLRDELLPLPPLPRELELRREPWLDRILDRERYYERRDRRYLFNPDLDRDYPRLPEDLDIALRDRNWLPPPRPLSPHRPFSPVRARSPLPPLPPIERYLDERWKVGRDLEDFREREYPERPLWHEDRPQLLPERTDLDLREERWAGDGGLDPLPAPAPMVFPDQPALPEADPSSSNVVALSQRQHEIILKAAQELKMLREQKEQLENLKHLFGEAQTPDTQQMSTPIHPPAEVLQPPVVPVIAEEPPCDRRVADHWDEDNFSGLWEEERRNLPAVSKLPAIQQTVDYGHGRDLAVGKVEQTSYGERVVLPPDPALERKISSFHKDLLGDCGDRDLRDFFDRPSSKSLDRREYDRERDRERDRDRDRSDTHRDRGDHDRERFERDRHSRDDRSSYRDKDSSSRRSDRKPDRVTFDVPGFGGSRRGFQEERSTMPPPMPVPPPEKKPETKNVDDLLKAPGRASRPDRIVVIMRGLPGSGKTHVAKLIRDKEVECGGSAPRVLSLDDYFITEVEKVEKDPESGKKVKKKVMEYEYEPEMEETYRSGMLKTFKKTLDDGFFPFIILDSIHDRVRHFEQFWSAAKTKGFEVYLAEITADTQTCSKRNVHGRKLKDICKMSDNWEPAPRHMIRLDIRSLLQDAAIEEVEMEDSEPSAEPEKDVKEAGEEEESDRGYLPKSKWEMDTSEAKLDKLDGLKTRKRDWESMAGCLEDYLQLPDDYDSRESEPGKKRVRWADLEEKKDADRKRAIGFVVGQTDWEKITDKSGHLAERALNRTKYI